LQKKTRAVNRLALEESETRHLDGFRLYSKGIRTELVPGWRSALA
jgi:hypothetical protein